MKWINIQNGTPRRSLPYTLAYIREHIHTRKIFPLECIIPTGLENTGDLMPATLNQRNITKILRHITKNLNGGDLQLLPMKKHTKQPLSILTNGNKIMTSKTQEALLAEYRQKLHIAPLSDEDLKQIITIMYKDRPIALSNKIKKSPKKVKKSTNTETDQILLGLFST